MCLDSNCFTEQHGSSADTVKLWETLRSGRVHRPDLSLTVRWTKNSDFQTVPPIPKVKVSVQTWQKYKNIPKNVEGFPEKNGVDVKIKNRLFVRWHLHRKIVFRARVNFRKQKIFGHFPDCAVEHSKDNIILHSRLFDIKYSLSYPFRFTLLKL